MLSLALSLILTGLLLALPGMSWSAYKSRRGQADSGKGKLPFRLLIGCTAVAWGVQTLSYIILAGAQGPIEVRQAIQLTTPLGGLIWLAALTGLACFIVITLKKRSSQKKAPTNGQIE